MKRIFLLALAIISHFNASAQTTDLYKTEGIVNELHRANIGKVTFMKGNIPLDHYREADFLKSFWLTPKSDLNIRVFMNNSVANYLHQLAPDLSADSLVKSGNLQFKFYVDGKEIYTENVHHGATFGSGGSKNTSTTFRVPLTSSKGEDWWAMYMWDRFKAKGGEKALTNGTHDLKVEIRPYIKMPQNSAAKVGEIVAQGEIKLIIKPIEISAKQIQVEPIRPNSGWQVSKAKFDVKKIESLNAEIARYNLKDITSIVVVKEGKLLLEEYFNGADRNTLHDTRSATKSFTSTLMGIAINDGHIKDEYQTLDHFYDLKQFTNYESKKDSIKLKDLLSMSSAFMGSDADGDSPGNEENMYPTNDWVKFTLDLPMDKTKVNGVKWDYFTAGVVLLGDILHKSVPDGLEKYAEEKLFKPLGITKYQWQYTPQKVANTAGSLQMTALDYARYAQLYKNKGLWKGKQIIPAKWVDKTLSHQIQIIERNNEYYSYLFWNKAISYKGKSYETYYCAGNGGNHFIIFKDLPLVIIVTAKAYNKAYAHPQVDRIVSEFILPSIL